MLRSFAVLSFALICAGCAADIAPWERGLLAEPAMQLGNHATAAELDRQFYFSREAGRGGESFSGTGCGCN